MAPSISSPYQKEQRINSFSQAWHQLHSFLNISPQSGVFPELRFLEALRASVLLGKTTPLWQCVRMEVITGMHELQLQSLDSNEVFSDLYLIPKECAVKMHMRCSWILGDSTGNNIPS